MKEISTTLYSFLDNSLKEPKNIINKNIKLSQTSIKFIKKLYGYIIQSHLEWLKKPYIKDIGFNSNDVNNKFPKGKYYNGIPQEIRKVIESSKQSSKVFEFSIKHRKIRIHFVYNETSHNINKIMIYLQKIYMWVYVCNIYSPINCSNNLDIYLYLTDLKKNIPNNNLESFDRMNVNTGYTYACMYEDIVDPLLKNREDSNELIIFREEEWFKVLIHETFHSMGLDFSSMDNSNITKKIQEIFHIKNIKDIRLYESYTEICAELIHSVFFAHFVLLKYKKLENMDYTYKKIEEIIQNEILFSLFQSVKILDHFGLNYDQLYNNETDSIDFSKKNNQENSIYSYYILKSIIIFHMNNFIEWMYKNNRGSFRFNHNNDTIINYISFFRENYKNPLYINVIKMIEKNFKTIKENKNNDVEIKTLRMTMFEM